MTPWARLIELDQLAGAHRDYAYDSDDLEYERAKPMTELLNDLAPNGDGAKTVSCRVDGCDNDAPKMGRFAGRCPEHRKTADLETEQALQRIEKKRKPKAEAPESELVRLAQAVVAAEAELAKARGELLVALRMPS